MLPPHLSAASLVLPRGLFLLETHLPPPTPYTSWVCTVREMMRAFKHAPKHRRERMPSVQGKAKPYVKHVSCEYYYSRSHGASNHRRGTTAITPTQTSIMQTIRPPSINQTLQQVNIIVSPHERLHRLFHQAGDCEHRLSYRGVLMKTTHKPIEY